MCQLNTEPMTSQTAYLSVTGTCHDIQYYISFFGGFEHILQD